MNATQRNLYNELCDELTNRGIDYRKPDVFSFANNARADATVEQLADDWIASITAADFLPCVETQQEADILAARAAGTISDAEIREAGFGHLLD